MQIIYTNLNSGLKWMLFSLVPHINVISWLFDLHFVILSPHSSCMCVCIYTLVKGNTWKSAEVGTVSWSLYHIIFLVDNKTPCYFDCSRLTRLLLAILKYFYSVFLLLLLKWLAHQQIIMGAACNGYSHNSKTVGTVCHYQKIPLGGSIALLPFPKIWSGSANRECHCFCPDQKTQLCITKCLSYIAVTYCFELTLDVVWHSLFYWPTVTRKHSAQQLMVKFCFPENWTQLQKDAKGN